MRSSCVTGSRTGWLAAALSAAELLQDYERWAEIVKPEPLPSAVTPMMITCSHAQSPARPTFILSRDKDLLDLREYQGAPVLLVADALQRLAISDARVTRIGD